MTSGPILVNPLGVFLMLLILQGSVHCMSREEKRQLQGKVVEMFNHAYQNYMLHAFPADELMPISCQGRGRGTQPSRGDIDDVLGNFSLSLIDSLDTLVVLGQVHDFEDAIWKVIDEVSFDSDIVVSVFETNIRVLGGLLGGHVMAVHLKRRGACCSWYTDQLLTLATDIGNRLLPAFNTTTGIPYPRVNLRYGVKPGTSRTGHEKDTCTACAGTMILEFAALSRLTGDPIYESKAHTAMEFLWKQRHRSSDLVGTVINIHNGDWVRRESGVGAGIDSYYEYMLKAYILLGDEMYLDRFNKHYEAVMRYVSQGPMMVDVHMHRPLSNSRNFMDALLAFWPGLQVLKGDLKAAIETHEMLYQVTQRHNFLPEAFTTDFRVHWGQHPLRPEFVESTYFIYKATGDPYYLEVGRTVMENLDKHARVACGFAAIKDVTTGIHEDQMDSYVLAETFKYLYLLFTDKEDLIVDIDDYIFTTEAHLLPLSLSISSPPPNATNRTGRTHPQPDKPVVVPCSTDDDDGTHQRTCPNTQSIYSNSINYAHSLRLPLKNLVERICPKPKERGKPRLRAANFIAGDKDQLEELRRMGIRIATMKDGRVQLLHTSSEAASSDGAVDGMIFMQEMIDLSKQQQQEVQQEPRVVQLLSHPYLGNQVFNAGPAQFGYDLKTKEPVYGIARRTEPYKACQTIQNHVELRGNIAVMERGDCMFIDKARNIQTAGAIGGIVIDHNDGTNSETSPLFAMSGDGRDDIGIPILFLFHQQGAHLVTAMDESKDQLYMMLGYQTKPPEQIMKLLLERRESMNTKEPEATAAKASGPDQVPNDVLIPTPNAAKARPLAEAATQADQHQTALKMESDATRLLLNKYMKKMKLGDIEVQIRESRQWNQEAESLLQIIEGPDNNKHVSVQLENLVTSETEQKIAKVYDELVKLLMSHTNLYSLADRRNYLEALGDLVKTAFIRGESGLDTHAQATLDRLATELRLKTEAEKEESNSQPSTDTASGTEDLIKVVQTSEKENVLPKDANRFYLVDDKRAEEDGASRSAVIKKAPEWMGLHDGEVMVDDNGVMYVTEGYDFDEDVPSSSSIDDLVKLPSEIGSDDLTHTDSEFSDSLDDLVKPPVPITDGQIQTDSELSDSQDDLVKRQVGPISDRQIQTDNELSSSHDDLIKRPVDPISDGQTHKISDDDLVKADVAVGVSRSLEGSMRNEDLSLSSQNDGSRREGENTDNTNSNNKVDATWTSSTPVEHVAASADTRDEASRQEKKSEEVTDPSGHGL